MSAKVITVPDIGDFEGVEIIEVLVSEGDTIKAEDSLITVESDKASMEIPSPESGVVKALNIKLGDRISQGDPLLELEPSNDAEAEPVETLAHEPPSESQQAPEAETVSAQESAPTPSGTHMPAPENKPSPTAKINEVSFSKAYASPGIRRFARELGVDLGKVEGSGRKGRIVREDVKQYIKRALSQGAGGLGVAPMPEIDFSQWGQIETVPLTKINKLTGEFLHRNWVTVPHVTQFDEADITDLEDFRKSMVQEYKEQGIRVTLLVFLMKALVSAMKEFPRFNSSLDTTGENLILKNYYHIGIAVDTPDGLVVPVVRDVDRKSLVLSLIHI